MIRPKLGSNGCLRLQVKRDKEQNLSYYRWNELENGRCSPVKLDVIPATHLLIAIHVNHCKWILCIALVVSFMSHQPYLTLGTLELFHIDVVTF